MLQTVDKAGVEIFSTGVFNGDQYDLRDLQAMVDAFDKVNFQPAIKAGHERGQESPGMAEQLFGSPSLGHVERIYVRGTKLLADLKNIPKRFADLVNAGAYRRISAEIFWDLADDATGRVYPRVLKAVAFLGAKIPAITSLKAIENLYGFRHAGGSLRFATFEINSSANSWRNYMQTENNEQSMSEASYSLSEKIKVFAAENGMSFRDAAHKLFAESQNSSGAVQSLGALLGSAVSRGDINLACEIAAGNPQLARDAAGEFLLREANKLNVNLPGTQSQNQSMCLQQAMQKFPAVAELQGNGTVTPEALREIFGQWFKS